MAAATETSTAPCDLTSIPGIPEVRVSDGPGDVPELTRDGSGVY